MNALALVLVLAAQQAPKESEEDYYPLIRIPIPKDIMLEAGGIELMPDG